MHLQRRNDKWMNPTTGEILTDGEATLLVQGELLAKTTRELELAKATYAQVKMQVDALISEHFPQFVGLEQAVTNLQYDYEVQTIALKQAVIADHAQTGAKSYLNGAVLVVLTERTTHFDEQQALDYADEMGLVDFVKRTPIKSKFESLAKASAKKNAPLPREILMREMVAETRLYSDKLIKLGE